MKEAFDKYFEKLNKLYAEEFGTKPTVSFSETYNNNIFISEPDEYGEAEWEPKLQETAIDWNRLEEELKFKICDELKAYFSTYSFAQLEGDFGKISLCFDPVDLEERVEDSVKNAYKTAQYLYPGSEIFALGMAEINDDDGYTIYFNNQNNKIFCYEDDTKKTVELTESLETIIGTMEAVV